MTPTANLAPAVADADHPAAPAAETDSFVLNLCSSTTPMALAQTDLPELKRFTFFVSRRFEEGRERFRLHMGFFASLAEAEEWLSLVRDIYPGAWAGEAPGKKLRARASAAAAAQARHAVGPQKNVDSAAAPNPTSTVPPEARPQSLPSAVEPKVPRVVPTLHPPAAEPADPPTSSVMAGTAQATAAPHPVKAVGQQAAKRTAVAAGVARAVAPAAARAPTQSPVALRTAKATGSPPPKPQTAAPPASGLRPGTKAAGAKPVAPTSLAAPLTHGRAATVTAAAKPPLRAASSVAQRPEKKPIFADSNVKEVLAALDAPEDATGETRLMPVIVGASEGVDESALTDTQVLRFLETRRNEDGAARARPAPQVEAAVESGISLLKPDDTGTRRALKEAVSHDEPVSFAVQLQWSVQPVELDKVPPLAIFSAYTLYCVEGSREGRKWYGLRLGFFTDAISAKQVAYYVRSEFNSVAVVPVSPQERERATEDNRRFSGLGSPPKRREREDSEFKLIDSEETPRAATSPEPLAPARNVRKGGAKVGARERRTPQTLEETLEILGANDLAIENANGDTLSDTGVRHLRVEIQKNTPFSRLLERLSERVRKS